MLPGMQRVQLAAWLLTTVLPAIVGYWFRRATRSLFRRREVRRLPWHPGLDLGQPG
jgi:hypothetical protein